MIDLTNVATLGDAIRLLRTDKRWTLRELGRKVDMSPAFLSDLEKNRRSTQHLDLFESVLEVPSGSLQRFRPSSDLRAWLAAQPELMILLERCRVDPVMFQRLLEKMRVKRGA